MTHQEEKMNNKEIAEKAFEKSRMLKGKYTAYNSKDSLIELVSIALDIQKEQITDFIINADSYDLFTLDDGILREPLLNQIINGCVKE